MKPLGDRRSRIRLEVVGSLWGTLELVTHASILNISRGGALILSPVAPPSIDSIQTVRLTLNEQQIAIEARVRHVSRVTEGGEDQPSYRVGMEFLQIPAALVHILG